MAERGESGEPQPKKRKRSETIDDIEKLLNVLESPAIDRDLPVILKTLCEEKRHALCALTICQCNAAAGYGVPFSRAWCHTVTHFEQFYSFAYFFESGFQHLENLFTEPKIVPDEENAKECVIKLLTFLSDKDSKRFLENLNKKANLLNNKTRFSVALAEHLFKKLTLKSNYTLDDHCEKGVEDNECRCGCHTPVFDKFGNTSIGHPYVWHGNIDMIVGKDDVPVVIEGPDPDSPGPVEVKYNDAIEDINVKQQMLAKSIVFSFLQKKRHPHTENFLIPCVGVSWQQLVFYFYDSQNDVLLQSSTMPLVSEGEMNFTAIVALWLVLNYKQFCSGLPKNIDIPKANFNIISEEEMEIYNDQLSFGDVWCRGFSMKFDPVAHSGAKFIYPANE